MARDTPNDTSHPHVLLIQFRDDDFVCEHERGCVLGLTGLPADRLETINVVPADTPHLTYDDIAHYDAVIMGGAGAHSATEDEHFTGWLSALTINIVRHRLPLFGSCYGHQFIARALGGSVITDDDTAEVGEHDIELTDAAETDDLFGHLPGRFHTLMGHRDRVDRLPPDAVELAYSELCRNQAFRIEGRPVWCAQFHAELTPVTLLERLDHYRTYANPEEIEHLKNTLRPTPESATILPRFLEYAANHAKHAVD